MANQKLLKKVAPVVLSAAMAMTSMPAAAMAADFSDSDVVSDAVDVEETQDAEAEVEVDEDDADDTADVDVVEDNAADAAEADSEEDLFSSEVTEDEFSDQAGDDQTTGEAYVLMNIPYDDFYKAELKNNDVKVDAFTSATKNKSRTAGMMNGNSAYHVDPEGTDVSGVTFPVKVSDLAVLKDQKKVTDDNNHSYQQRTDSKQYLHRKRFPDRECFLFLLCTVRSTKLLQRTHCKRRWKLCIQ